MSSIGVAACREELAERANPTPAVDSATLLLRRVRAEQLDEVDAVVNGAAFYAKGFRSATDWLMVTTREGVGSCKLTLHLADRIQVMPIVKTAFGAGLLPESSLRLLTHAWADPIADVFARDEQMLCDWATTMPHQDFKLVLQTWRMHANPDREAATAHEQFDSRALHLASLLDGIGVIDGKLDPEGFTLLREAIRLYSQPSADETRNAAQRRADALVTIARMAIEAHVSEPGRKRRKAKVIATIAYDDLVAASQAARLHDSVESDGDGTDDEHAGANSATRRSSDTPLGGSVDTDLDRIIVPAAAVRRMACDCDLHRYITNPLGTVVDYGRSNRVVSDTQFDTLLIRDHGCRWPGCGIPAGGCDAHHATHWLDGGETKPDNLALLCWFHHRLLHEQHWSIEPLGGGHFNLNDPTGDATLLRPPLVGLALPTDPPDSR